MWNNIEPVRQFAIKRFTRPALNPLIYYTDHSYEHSERVWEYCQSLAGLLSTKLSLMEMYILEAAAYLHDSALFLDETKARHWLKTIGIISTDLDELSSEEIASLLRTHHHTLAYELIMSPEFDNICRFGKLQREVAKCARAHRFSPDESLQDALLTQEYDPVDYRLPDAGSPTIRVRLLGAILRLADELDLDWQKASVDVNPMMSIPIAQQCYWHLHMHISSVTLMDGRRINLQFHLGNSVGNKNPVRSLIHSINDLHFSKIRLEYQRLSGVEELPALDLAGPMTKPRIVDNQPHAYVFTDPTISLLERFLKDKMSEIENTKLAWENSSSIVDMARWLKSAQPRIQQLFLGFTKLPVGKLISLDDLPSLLKIVKDPYEFQPIAREMVENGFWNGHGDEIWEWTEKQMKIAEAACSIFKHMSMKGIHHD